MGQKFFAILPTPSRDTVQSRFVIGQSFAFQRFHLVQAVLRILRRFVQYLRRVFRIFVDAFRQ